LKLGFLAVFSFRFKFDESKCSAQDFKFFLNDIVAAVVALRLVSPKQLNFATTRPTEQDLGKKPRRNSRLVFQTIYDRAEVFPS